MLTWIRRTPFDDVMPYVVSANRFLLREEIEPMKIWCSQNVGACRNWFKSEGKWTFHGNGCFSFQSASDMTLFILAFSGI